MGTSRPHSPKTIAFIGSHGTGKTTVLNALVKSLPQAPIVLHDVFRAHAVNLGYERPRSIIEEEGDSRRELAISALTASAIGVVAAVDSSVFQRLSFPLVLIDQGPVGYYAYYRYWIKRNANELDGPQRESSFIEKLARYYSQYITQYIYFPVGVIPLVTDGLRPINLKFQETIDGLIFEGIDSLEIPESSIHRLHSVEVSDRVAEILQFLRQ